MADDQQATVERKQSISPALVLLFISGVIGLLAAGAVLLVRDGGSGTPTPPPEFRSGSISNWRADDFELTSLTGATVRLSDYEGRPVFLNFWRTDCPPCVRELPAFQTFVREQGERGAAVLAINQGEDAETIREFLAEIGISDITVLLDKDYTLERDYPVRALPTTYVVDGDGMVQYQKLGEMKLDEMYVHLQDFEEQSSTGG